MKNFHYSPILAITQYSIETYYDSTLVSVCFTKVETLMPSLFFILSISIFFFLPLAILLILYALIAKTLMDHHPNLIASSTTGKHCSIPSHSVIKHRKQVVLMLGTVVFAFFVCLLPFRALTLWIIIVPADDIMNLGVETFYNILYFSRIMFHINSAINPILYNVMSSKFRGGFFKLCGMKVIRKRLKKRHVDRIDRKNTFNTTSSTTNTSSHPTANESFWNRYSSGHRNASRHSSGVKEIVVDVGKETIDATGSSAKNNNRDERKDTVVRMSRKANTNLRSDISFV